MGRTVRKPANPVSNVGSLTGFVSAGESSFVPFTVFCNVLLGDLSECLADFVDDLQTCGILARFETRKRRRQTAERNRRAAS